MGIWSRLFGGEQKTMSSLGLFKEVYGGRESKAGPPVNWMTALQVATVLACVRVRANGVAQVPFRVYQEVNGGKRVATEHPLQMLLSGKPNPWQTSFSMRETLEFHLCMTGNAFLWVGRVGRNRDIRAIEPIEPGRVTIKKASDGTLTYLVTAYDGAQKTFSADEIWHIRGPSWNAWAGMDAVKLTRDAIGLAIATENSQADFHKGGARVSGLLSTKDKLGAERFKLLSEWLDKHSDGGDRAGKPLILDDDTAWQSMAMTGVDSQHLETRKHQIEEICRGFGVMPIMVGHADKTATYASAEQMFLAHVVHCLAPEYSRIEQSADAQLLSEADRAAGYYTKFNATGLMRGAAADRAVLFTAALGDTQRPGWLTRNEVRALEDMDPMPGGDEFIPLITQTGANDGTD